MKLYRQKKSKFWWVDHTFPDGSRIRESTKKADKSVARSFAQAIIAQYESKEKIVVRKGSFWAQYLPYATARKSPKTVKLEKQIWERFLKFLGRDDPSDISVEQAEEYITSLLKLKMRPATVNGYHRVIKLILNKAVQWKYILENPFNKISMQIYERELPRYLTQKEINDLFDHAWRVYPEYVPLFQFYLLTGTRRAEAIGLSWADVDFDAGIILIRTNDERPTKGKRARVIPMLPLARKILESRRKFRKPFDFHPDVVTQVYSKVAFAAKIKETSLHDLRRSFATYLAPDMEQSALMKILGHEDFRVTDMYYLGANTEEMKKRMSKLEDILKKSSVGV